MLTSILKDISSGRNLTMEQAESAMDLIIQGSATPAQIGALLASLRLKGETAQEVAGMARAMRKGALHISPVSPNLVDTCGTGGDGPETFNISTTAAFITAACGLPVAKHGNRSASGRIGSADVLEALGVRLDIPPSAVERCIDGIGIGFLFAPVFHPGVRNAMGPRRELGFPTIFNILGPLANPAGTRTQLIGVNRAALGALVAETLPLLGIKRGMVVHGSDGLDEVTLTGPTDAWIPEPEGVRRITLTPDDFGLDPCSPIDLKGGDSNFNARVTLDILSGVDTGPKFRVALANTACILVTAGVAADYAEGTAMAREAVRSGKCLAILSTLREKTREFGGEVAI